MKEVSIYVLLTIYLLYKLVPFCMIIYSNIKTKQNKIDNYIIPILLSIPMFLCMLFMILPYRNPAILFLLITTGIFLFTIPISSMVIMFGSDGVGTSTDNMVVYSYYSYIIFCIIAFVKAFMLYKI